MNDVGNALVEVLLDGVRGVPVSRSRRFFAWLAKLTNPPVGLRIVSDDGGAFTGFIVVEKNVPIAVLALRVGTASPVALSDPARLRHPHGGPSWSADDCDLFA